MKTTDQVEWEVEDTEESETDERDVIAYEINYYPADITLKGYLDKWEANQLRIPEFQRSYVWDQVKASKLIESFLLGLPVPGVFLYKERKTNRLLVIDGQQRILSAINYFKGLFNERAFRLKNVRECWEGKTYDELPEADQFKLQDSVLRATIIQQLDPEDDSSIYHIFERLNTGGVNLNPMEIRKCVYRGPFYALLEELNGNELWQAILGRRTPDKRLRDIELVLRVLAMANSWNDYTKPMKQFLSNHMIQYSKMSEDKRDAKIDTVRNQFTSALSRVTECLCEKPFHLRGRLNYAELDSIFATVVSSAEALVDNLDEKYKELIGDKEFQEACTRDTSDEKVVKQRFNIARSYLLDNK